MKLIITAIALISFIGVRAQSVVEIVSPPSDLSTDHPGTTTYSYIEEEDNIQLMPGFSYTPQLSNSFQARISLFQRDALVDVPSQTTTRVQVNTQLKVGSIDGSLYVNEIGQPTYIIPLSGCKGTSSMEPELSIKYEGTLKDGLLGTGWDIQGIHQITRRAKTISDGGINSGLTLTNSDHFVFNGEKLIPIVGANGQSNTQYGTESEKFEKIESIGQLGAGPLYFTLTNAEGIKYYIGSTENSRVTAPNGTVLYWFVSRIEDANGNYITFRYRHDEGDCVIERVEYTGNAIAGLNPYAAIDFNYQKRSAPILKYFGSKGITRRLILSKVEMKYDNQLIRSYGFKYKKDLYDKLLEIEESVNGYAKNSTVINWEDIRMDYQNDPISYTGPNNGEKFFETVYASGDFDGDGLTDFISKSVQTSSTHYGLTMMVAKGANHTNNNYGKFVIPQIWFQNALQPNPMVSVMDYDDDGKDEVYIATLENQNGYNVFRFLGFIYSNNNIVQINNDITSQLHQLEPDFPVNSQYLSLIPTDFNGNGILEACVLRTSNPNQSKLIKYMERGIVTDSFEFTTRSYSGTINPMMSSSIIDFNGDLRHDFGVRNNHLVYVFTYDITTNVFNRITVSVGLTLQDRITWGDFNGDRLTDLMIFRRYQQSDANIEVWLSNGSNFSIAPSFSLFGAGIIGAKDFSIMDFNNDGLDDVVFTNTGTNTSWNSVRLSNGYAFVKYFGSTYTLLNGLIWADANSDGFKDIVGKGYIYYFANGQHYFGGNAVISITDGMNRRHAIHYGGLKIDLAGGRYVRENDNSLGIGYKVPPMKVVTKVEVKHSITDQLLSYNDYWYADAVHDPTKKGFIGFRKLTKFEFNTNKKVVSTNAYNNTYVFLYPQKKEVFFNNVLAGLETYTYDIISRPFNRYWLKRTLYSTADLIRSTTNNVHYAYTSDGYISSETQLNGYNTRTFSRTFVPITLNGRVVQKVAEEVTQYQNPFNTMSSKSSYVYDSKGNIEKVTKEPGTAASTSVNYIRNQYGLVTERTQEANGLTTLTSKYVYDAYGRVLLTETNPLGQVAEFRYDGHYTKPVWERNFSGELNTYAYDGWGDLILHTDPYNEQTTTTASWTNPNTSIWDSYKVVVSGNRSPSQTKNYNAHNLVEQHNYQNYLGEEVKIDYVYTNQARLASVSKPYLSGENPIYTQFTYDDFNRIKSENDLEDGTTTEYTYPSSTERKKELGPSGVISDVTTEYNADRTIKSITDLSGTINYVYNGMGSVVSISGNCGATSMIYDAFNRRIAFTDPVGTITNTYNARGQVVSEVDVTGKLFTFEYDVLGRLIKKRDEVTGLEQTTAYVGSGNGLNKVQSKKDFSGITETYGYDDRNRLVSLLENVQGNSFTTKFEYINSSDQLAKKEYPSGVKLVYTYNSVGNVVSMKRDGEANPFWQVTQVDARNNPKLRLLQNGMQWRNTYHKGYPENNQIVRSDNAKLFDYQYSFDAASGNLTLRKDLNKPALPMEEFEYDQMQRLKLWKVSYTDANNTVIQVPTTASFSSTGNIQRKSDASDLDYVYGAIPNAVTEIPTPKTAIAAFELDDLSYTQEQDVQYIVRGNQTKALTYGPSGERKRVISAVGTTQVEDHFYIGDYEKIITPTGVQHLHYLKSPFGLVGILSVNASNQEQLYYTFTDYLGSVLGLYKPDGTVSEEYNFDPWGRRRNPQNWSFTNVPVPTWQKRGFTGHEHYDDLGVINMNARLYDPVLGRMLSPDRFIQSPEYSQNFNRFSYAYNNPLSYTDPTGNTLAKPVNVSGTSSLANEYLFSINESGTGSKLMTWEEFEDKFTEVERQLDAAAAYFAEKDEADDAAEQEAGGGDPNKKTNPTNTPTTGDPPKKEVTKDAQGGEGGIETAILDGVQTGLDVVGLIPGVGEIADGVNALIYTGRGDYVNAGLSAAAMMPFAGWAATGGKLGNKALHYSKLADKAHGTASTFNKTTPINSKIMFNDITQGFPKKVIQTPKGPIIRADMGNGLFIQMRGFDRSGSHTTFDFINSNGLFYEFKFNR